MVKKINTFTLSAAIYLIMQCLWILPANSSSEPQVPRLTFRIPRSNTRIPSPFVSNNELYTEDWSKEFEQCSQENARASGKPFGISKARYSLAGLGNQERSSFNDSLIMVVGCITNNSGRIVDENTIEVVFIRCSDGGFIDPSMVFPELYTSSFRSGGFSGVAVMSPGLPLDPSLQVGSFFFFLHPNTSTTTCFIEQPSPPGQTETYVPVERLDITIVR
jgi:hypothetical protein